MRRLPHILALLLSVLAVAVVGCGGDEDASTSAAVSTDQSPAQTGPATTGEDPADEARKKKRKGKGNEDGRPASTGSTGGPPPKTVSEKESREARELVARETGFPFAVTIDPDGNVSPEVAHVSRDTKVTIYLNNGQTKTRSASIRIGGTTYRLKAKANGQDEFTSKEELKAGKTYKLLIEGEVRVTIIADQPPIAP